MRDVNSPTPPFPPDVPFSVTNLQGDQTLTVSRTNSTNIEMRVAGVPQAWYIVQTSTNLLDWTNVRTNFGGPFTHTAPVQSSDQNRYYRVEIFGNWEATAPGPGS